MREEGRPSRRRLLLGLFATVGLGGCGLGNTESPLWATVSSGFQQKSLPPVDRDYVNRVPYASILAWFDGAPMAFMVLSQVQADRLVWLSADRRALVTQGPYVVQTVALEANLDGTSFPDGYVIPGASSTPVKRLIDLRHKGYFSWPVSSTSAVRQETVITILDVKHKVREVQEDVTFADGTRATNAYWFGVDDGICWKTRQTIIPGQPVLNIEILRPYG